MATYIRIQEYCAHYQVPEEFVIDLISAGLLSVSDFDAAQLHEDQLIRLERFRKLHYDLHINLEGIETIDYLLERQMQLQNELTIIKSKLRLYE